MNWRPEGWKNPHHITVDSSGRPFRYNHDAYEGGADAMLQAVCWEIGKSLLNEQERIEQATLILRLIFGKDVEWGRTGTVDDESWRKVEMRILAVVDRIADERRDKILALFRKEEAQEPIRDGSIGPDKGLPPDWRNRVLRKEVP